MTLFVNHFENKIPSQVWNAWVMGKTEVMSHEPDVAFDNLLTQTSVNKALRFQVSRIDNCCKDVASHPRNFELVMQTEREKNHLDG